VNRRIQKPPIGLNTGQLDQLNHTIGQINSQVGKLAPDKDPPEILVAYRINGFKPRLDIAGGVNVDLMWFTQPAVCMHKADIGNGGMAGTICGVAATHIFKGAYLCTAHAQGGAVGIADILAKARAERKAAQGPGHGSN